MTYFEGLDLISVGFRDGKIQTFYMNIEFDRDCSDSDSGDEQSGFSQIDNQKKLDGTLLMKKAFEQIEEDV